MSGRDHHPPCPGGCGELADECMTPGCGNPLGSMEIVEPVGSFLPVHASRWVTVTSEPEVGDMAFHVNGYDPRTVTKVDGPRIWISILNEDVGPCDVENYTFKRQIH